MNDRLQRILLGVLGATIATSAAARAQDPTGDRPREAPYTVGEALPPVDEGSTLVSMTLEDAIARALEHNLDLQTARLDPTIQQWSLRSARAAFSPTLGATYGFTNQTNQSTSQLDGGQRTTTKRQNLNLSLSQTTPWYGGRLTASFNNSRNETNNTFATLNPSYRSTLSLDYTQPILAGREIDARRAAVETQEIQAEITDLRLRSRLENITNQVRRSYWGLRAAIDQIEIQRRSLAQAEQLLAENRILIRAGRATEIQAAQVEAQVASAQQALLNAEIQWRNQQLAFKRLLLSGADDPLLAQTVNPTTSPAFEDPSVDIEGAIDRALRERTDIRQQRRQRDVTTLNVDVSDNNTLPDLNLTASYSLLGVGGNEFERQGLGGEPVLVERGGYIDGLQSIADFDTPTWSLTLSASYPLGVNPASTDAQRARLELRQAEIALRSQELAIVTEVTAAGLAVQNTFLQLEAARRSREAAERSAEAELARFGVGAATNFEVVSAQNALTGTRLSELQALIDHAVAIAEFERVQRVGG